MKRPKSHCRLPESRGFWVTLSIIFPLAEIALLVGFFWDQLNNGDIDITFISNFVLGIAASSALPLAIWRGIVGDKQSAAAKSQAETAQQGLRNDRYQKAAEMLGNKVLPVRLGGIYALQRLSSEYPEEHHIQIMKLLCAFACDPTKDEGYEEKLAKHNSDNSKLPRPRKDVQAVMDFIASRDKTQLGLEKSQDFTLDLMGADLSHVQIIDADLHGAMLNGAKLFHANIVSVNLSGAYLTSTIMKKATLNAVEFDGASGWGIDLSGATVFQNKKPLFHLDDAKLIGAQLYEVDLSGKLIQHSNLKCVQIYDSDLSNTHFLDSNLSGARIVRTDMSGATLHRTDLSGTHFYGPWNGGDKSSITGLTQGQLDQACADPDNPPKLDDIVDAETGEPLVWRGKPCEK